MPVQVRFSRSTVATAEVADALLREGVLRPSDWTGSLAATVQAGLSRWVHEDLAIPGQGAAVAVELLYTDSLERIYDGQLGAQAWAQDHDGDPAQPVGAFALRADHYREFFVGETVQALNRVQGRLGFHVLALLSRALERTVGAVTPCWVASDLEWRGVEHTDEEIEEFDILTLEKFHRLVPKGACAWEFKRSSMVRALRPSGVAGGRGDRPRVLTPHQREIVETALQLSSRYVEVEKLDNDVPRFETDTESVLPVAVRWSPRDQMNRVSDEFHDCLANSGFETDLVWAACFQVHQPETVREAVRRLKRLVPCVALADRLLRQLHHEPEEYRVRVRV